jgi:hypothetical protein
MTPSLTPQQIDAYGADGFVVVPDVFTSERILALQAATDEDQIARSSTSDTDTIHLFGITTRHQVLRELATDPAIVRCITPLLGPNIQLQHSKLATKPTQKGVGPFEMHQDFAFYPHTNTDLLSVMVAVDEMTPQNGCLQMVRGSHRLGLLDHSKDGYFADACQESQYWRHADEGRLVDVPLKAGDIEIHHCLTLHGSGPNH